MKDVQTLEKAARMALEALEYYQHRKIEWDYSDDAAITAIREALAEQPAKQGCMRCNTPKKCALYGCSPLTWPAEKPAQQEPVGTIEVTHHEGKIESWRFIKKPENAPAGIYDVYTSSQRKPWVGLTEEQIVQLSLEWPAETNDWASHIDFARAIEAKLKEKNS